MDKHDAIRKVQSLLAVAVKATYEPEAETARRLAEKLKAQHKLTDDDIEPVIQVDFSSLFAGFSGAEAEWRQEIGVEIKAILTAIETLVDKINKQKQPKARAKGLAMLYKELRERVEGGTQASRIFGRAVKIHRDHAIYHAYKVGKAESLERHKQWEKEYPSSLGDSYYEEQAEKDGLWAAETAGDLRNSRDAAAAVKRGGEAHRDAVEKRVREKPCVMCGSKAKAGGSFMWYRWVEGRCYPIHHGGDCGKLFREKYEQ